MVLNIQWISLEGISGVILPLFVIGLSVLSYTYVTKSHLYSVVRQIDQLQIDGVVVKPTIVEIKWWPDLLPGRQQKTAIKFDTYSIRNGGSHLSDATILESKYDFDPSCLVPIEEVWLPRAEEYVSDPDKYNKNFRKPDAELTGKPNYDNFGLHLTINTTDAKEVRMVIDRILRRIRWEIENTDAEYVESNDV